MGSVWIEPVVLDGRGVRLVPLSREHLPGLTDAGLAPELWRWTPTACTTPEEMSAYVESALDEMEEGVCLPFVILDKTDDRVIGSTRYANIVPADRRLEIGWTWVTPSRQRTSANTEAKLLLLTHAFERVGTVRVEFKTDVLNEKSRRALLRIGAKEEGIFRKHKFTASGRIRDTVYFSIIDTEWPGVKARLEGFLVRP
jgi:RimJ/RimL family protein N-acetyltransferase